MGNVLSMLGKEEESLKAYNKALEINPDNEYAYYNRGCYYSLLNKSKEALADLKMAINLDPQLKELAKQEKDYDNIRNLSEFKQIVGE
jgi:tetratricopeptide (TPR) repeat protein